MAQIIKYQGDDIEFTLKLKDDDGNYIDFTAYDNVLLYFYTNPNGAIAKFTLVPKTGFIDITLTDNYTLTSIVPSDITKVLKPGGAIFEANLVSDGVMNNIGVFKNIFTISPSLIKAESE